VEAREEAPSWRLWPGALGVQDQGSKGVSANHALVYKPELVLSLLTLYDMSHGACQDLGLRYSEQGSMALVVLSLVVVDLRSGPEQEPGTWHEQLVDAVKYFFQGFSHAELRLVLGAPSWHPERDSQRGRPAPGEDLDEAAFCGLSSHGLVRRGWMRVGVERGCRWRGQGHE